MKKVRLFAVAAAMGMFASTVAAAETTVGYTTTWEGVEEIIKVDVGNKVVAPVTTIKVVKETRTTDDEYEVTNDSLGFEVDANCWTSTGIAEDENGDNYSDAQVYYNDLTGSYDFEDGYFYSSRTEALTDYLVRKNLVLAPGAEEVDELFYSPVLGQYFEDLEAVYNFLEEKGLVETVYDEDGDFEAVYVNAKTITDKKGNELAKARIEIAALDIRKPELKTKEAVAAKLIGYVEGGNSTLDTNVSNLQIENKVLYNYVSEKSNTKFTLPFAGTWEHANPTNGNTVEAWEDTIATGSIVVVEDNKGELEIVTVIPGTDAAPAQASTTDYVYAGWTGDNAVVKGKAEYVTIVELVDEGEVSKLATIAPTKVGRFTPESTMVWDEEAGSFVKETDEYETFTGSLAADYKGYWDTYPYEYDEENEEDNAKGEFSTTTLAVSAPFGIENTLTVLPANTSDKWVLRDTNVSYNGKNDKEGKMTLAYGNGKEITVAGVEIEEANNDVLYPAFDSLETLVKVASKLSAYENIGVVWVDDDEVTGLVGSGADIESVVPTGKYYQWYTNTEKLANDPWSGFEDVATPKSEMRGTGSEACAYTVSVDSETVDAVVEASEVDTTVAGVKTMTLSAKVDGEVVATKDVKVVVAPRYERTYVNGKVAVLKSFYLDGTLYSEYHYDWAAKTYTATFYANDGVTVASTANGTL